MRPSIDVEEVLCKAATDIEAFDLEDPLLPDIPVAEKLPEQLSTKKPHLDGLRGVAALLVYIGHHVAWWYGPGGPIQHGFGYHGEMMFGTFPFIRILFTGGSPAVHIFFVLSGYVLSISLLQKLAYQPRRETYNDLASAVVRRPFRLFIPMGGVSLVFALVMHLPLGFAPRLAWPKPEPTIWKELWKWFQWCGSMMNPLRKYGSGMDVPWFPYDPPAWTMPVEYRGSLAVFVTLAVFQLAPAKYRIYLWGATGLVMLTLRDWAVACFMAGIVLAILDLAENGQYALLSRLTKWPRTISYNTIFVLAWWILCQPGDPNPEYSYATPGWYYMTKMIPPNYYNYENWRFWNTIGAVMMVYAVCNLEWLQRFFCLRIIQFLGKISFSLYLVHTPFVWTIGDIICRLLGTKAQDFETGWDDRLKIPDVGPQGISTGFLVAQSLIFPLTVLLSLVVWKLLDQPSVKVGHIIVTMIGLGKDRENVHRTRSANVDMAQYEYSQIPVAA